MKEKSTGWKVPLLFCGVIIGAALLLYLLLPAAPEPPWLPETLLSQAKAIVIDLDNPDGKPWNDAILDAASGFAPQEAKDARLVGVMENALAISRPDAACAAMLHIRSRSLRITAAHKLLDHACASPGQAPYGVFAVNACPDSDIARIMAKKLAGCWEREQESK